MVAKNNHIHFSPICVWFVLILFVHGVFPQGPVCEQNSFIGPKNPGNYNASIDSDKGFGYLLYGAAYIVPCCGTIRRWEFSNGDVGPIEFQAWRPQTPLNDRFLLVGVNEYNVQRREKRVAYVDYDVEPAKIISVTKGDVIGWYAPINSLVKYSNGTSSDSVWKLRHDDSVVPGTVIDFSKGSRQSGRTYGIQALLAPNRKPSFDRLLETSIRMDADVGTTVYTVVVRDDDPGDVTTLVVKMTSSFPFFAFDPKTRKLTVAQAMSVPASGQTFNIEFKVTDQCGEETFGALRVNVNYVERPTSQPQPTTSAATVTTTSYTDYENNEPDDDLSHNHDHDHDHDQDIDPDQDNRTASGTPAGRGGATEIDTEDEEVSEGGIIGGVIAAIVIVCFFILIIIGCVMKNKDKARTVPKDAENGDPKNQDSTNEINGETLKQDTDDAPYTSKQESTNANAVTKETIFQEKTPSKRFHRNRGPAKEAV